MNEEKISELAAELKKLQTGEAIRQFRLRLSDADAKRVIDHPSISPVERAAIKLAQAWRRLDPRGPGAYFDSVIVPCSDMNDPDGKKRD